MTKSTLDPTVQNELNKLSAHYLRDKAAEYEIQAKALREEAERLDPLFDDEHQPARGAPPPARLRGRVPKTSKSKTVSAPAVACRKIAEIRARRARRGKPGNLPASAIPGVAAEVLVELQRDPGEPQSCSAIAESLALPTNHVGQALAYLVKHGKLEKRGEKRASVYLVERVAAAEPESNTVFPQVEGEAEL